ncbi:F-box/SPRY domain-containing protein 1 [Tupaia chinensis]|uniref:F-box/SPRY domain-containing protein 1 n=1 Tax=Tupaia chinensis TaxID=246437 RepID=L9LER7_TUPCH|nr:F-box/SPRY domain-containing protein 1 [Tupaia chinensis]
MPDSSEASAEQRGRGGVAIAASASAITETGGEGGAQRWPCGQLLSELRSCALVFKHWYRCLQGDKSSEVWRSLCACSLAEEDLHTDILCNLPSYKAKGPAFQ